MSRDNNFLHSIASMTSFPCDLLDGEFRMEMRGRGEMYICGCKKILKYTDDEIVVSAKHFDISINGEKLSCASFHCSGIVIEGDIKNIIFGDKA